jgi:hypothetical protein
MFFAPELGPEKADYELPKKLKRDQAPIQASDATVGYEAPLWMSSKSGHAVAFPQMDRRD